MGLKGSELDYLFLCKVRLGCEALFETTLFQAVHNSHKIRCWVETTLFRAYHPSHNTANRVVQNLALGLDNFIS